MDVRVDVAGLGAWVRRRRESLGWTAYRLAQRSGLPDRYLRRLERGEPSTVGLETVARLAGALGVSISDLAGAAGVPGEAPAVGELMRLARDLTPGERRVLVRVAEALLEMRSAGELSDDDLLEQEPIAAYDRELRENGPGASGW